MNKGMASDLSLGRPTPATISCCASDPPIAAASALPRHAPFLMQQPASACDHQAQLQDAEFQSSLIARLECYVRALQGEREKLDAFRRELPICMGLLDDAIQASREKLTKVVASSSRVVACQASYSNYGNPAYAASIVNSKAGVHSTSPRPEQEESNIYTWSLAGNKAHAHAAHASDDEFEKAGSFKETQKTMMAAAHPPHFPTTSSHHLHLINYPPPPPPPPPTPSTCSPLFLNRFQQKEAILFNQDEEIMRQQGRKLEGFQNRLDFSSSRSNEEEHNIMIQRESNGYEGAAHEHDVHADEEAAAAATIHSPTLMIANMSNNMQNGTSSSGIMSSQTPRKARRCWSPELHQRFLHALHQLGGPQSATPKQIREVMHVEGLTNDEVKSHLQKFRLHTRRPAPIQASSEPAQQPHHLVLFGGIWVPTSPAESTPAAQLAACQLAGAGHATSSGNHNPYIPFQQVIGQNVPMQALMRAASSDQLDVQHVGLETASEVDVARSDQSTSPNGGLENNVHEDEDTEIHLGSKPFISREITSPIAKARYQ